MTEVPVTDWANYEGELPERYPHRQPRPGSRLGRTSPITGPDFGAYRKEKRRRLKASSPTLTVAKVEPDDRSPTFNKITFENGIVAGYPKSKNAKVGDKFVVSSQDGRFAHIMDAEEGNAPIQDPMEFGEMANWTPLDGSEGLKRKRAEAIQVESVAAAEDIRMIYVRTREAAEEEAEKFIRHYFPADMKYAYQINATDEPNRWEMLYERIPQGMESTYSAESPSATIPANEPSWVKPVATALGFALGFFGIHEIKKVL